MGRHYSQRKGRDDLQHQSQVDGDFDATLARVKEVLKSEGFGVLTEIDVAGTLKAKIGKDFRPYRILGACNPNYAFEALSEEAHIGVMLPCNVIVQRYDNGEVEVSSIDPATAMQSVGNAKLEGVASKVRDALKRVIDSI